MTTTPLKTCRNRSCGLYHLKIRTPAEKCIGCSKPLDHADTQPLGDATGGGYSFEVRQ